MIVFLPDRLMFFPLDNQLKNICNHKIINIQNYGNSTTDKFVKCDYKWLRKSTEY